MQEIIKTEIYAWCALKTLLFQICFHQKRQGRLNDNWFKDELFHYEGIRTLRLDEPVVRFLSTKTGKTSHDFIT